MNSISPDSPLRQCPTCERAFPPAVEFFYADPSAKSGLSGICKGCAKARAKARYAALHPHKRRERVEGMKRCPTCGDSFPATPEFFYRNRARKDGLHVSCKPCRKAADVADSERIRLSSRASHQKHREERLQKQRSRSEVNKVYRRQYNSTHRAQNAARGRRYRKAHPEILAGIDRVHKHKRKAQKKAVGGSYTTRDIQLQYTRQKGCCHWCHKKLGQYHVDHVIPLSRGGSNAPENIVIACPTCNMRKGAKLPHEWDGSGGRLL